MMQVFEFMVFTGGAYFGYGLAPLHLFDQEVDRHQGVALTANVVCCQVQQVFRPRQRLLQRLIGLVDPRCPLQRVPSFGLAGTRKSIRMDL